MLAVLNQENTINLCTRVTKTAAATNKLSFRLENQVLTNKEVPLAEKVDSDLVKREKVEATNIATRTPGAGDVAWMMERER